VLVVRLKNLPGSCIGLWGLTGWIGVLDVATSERLATRHTCTTGHQRVGIHTYRLVHVRTLRL